MRKTKFTQLLLTIAFILLFLPWITVSAAGAQGVDNHDVPKASKYELHFKFKDKSAVILAEKLLQSRAETIGGAVNMTGEEEIVLSLPKLGKKAQDKASAWLLKHKARDASSLPGFLKRQFVDTISISPGSEETSGENASDTVTESTYSASLSNLTYTLNAFQGGGTSTDPYLIYTAQDIDSIRYTASESAYYKLMNDIDLSDYGEWAPIGDYENEFNGIFDGNNHTISGLHINSGLEFLGLFGYAGGFSEINNIGLEDIYVSGTSGSFCIGGLVGYTEGSISNSYITGSVSCVGDVIDIGGLVGCSDGHISNSYSDCIISCTGSSNDIGDLVGYSGNGIVGSYAAGNVSSSGLCCNIGGLAGYSYSDISNSYSTGNVLCTDDSSCSNIGGLVGYSYSDISNSYSTGNVLCTGDSSCSNIGGLAGDTDGDIGYSYAVGNVSVSGICSTFGGLVGFSYGIINYSYANGSILCTGDLSSSDIGGLVGYANKDINYSHAACSLSCTGAFNSSDMGGLVGYAYGDINYSHAAGSMSCSNYTKCSDIGGLVGYAYASINNSYSTAIVLFTGDSVSSNYGSLAGYSRCGVSNSYATGHISSPDVNTGGLAGFADGINNSYWDIDTTGQTSCVGYGNSGNSGDNGKHTAQMKQQSTYVGWDFNTIWTIDEGNSYPYFIRVTNTAPKETLGKCPYCFFGKNSVNLSTGNFILEQTDLSLPAAGPSLEFTRFYNSQDDYEGAQGKGWTNNYNVNLKFNQDESVNVAYADGHVHTFNADAGGYTRPAGCFETLDSGPDNTYTLNFKDHTKYIFNWTGQLINIVDQNANTITLTYSSELLVSAGDQLSGAGLTFAYDSNNRLASVTDTADRTVVFGYDTNGNLTEVQDVLGNITEYHYGVQGLEQITAPDVNTLLLNEYSDDCRVTRQTDGNSNTTQFNYDMDNRQTTMTDALGNTTTAVDDEKYRGTGITYPGNITETFAYDDNNCRISVTDALNRTTNFSYDPGNFGNLEKVTDPAGNITQMEYDGRNNLLSVTNADGKQIQFTYDSNNNLLTMTDPFNKSTTYEYYSNGLLKTETTPDSDPGQGAGAGITGYTYFQNGLPETVTGPAGNTTSYEYDEAGWPKTITDAANISTSMNYDAAGNLKDLTDPLGNIISFTYDWRGDTLTMTDGRGNLTKYFYNGAGQLIKKIDALGNETSYEYNALNQLSKVTNPRGNSSLYSYDNLGRLTGVTNPLNHTTNYDYDPAGNLTGTTDALNNKVLSFDYDLLNNPVNIKDALGNTVANNYDKLSRLTSSTDPMGNITEYEYDDLNRLISVTDPNDGTSSQYFDAHDNRIKLTDPNNSNTAFTYDASDRLRGKSAPVSGDTVLDYNVRNLLASKTNARGQTTTYQYDDNGRLLNYTISDGETGSFNYDPNGNLLNATDSVGMVAYEYDELNRIIKYTDTRSNVIRYDYDADSNLKTLTYPGGRQVRYDYDAADRLIKVTDWDNRITSYTYDSNNRLIETDNPNGTKTSFTYDTAGRLTQMKDENISSIISQYDYTYDKGINITEEKGLNELPFITKDPELVYDEDKRLDTYNGQKVLYDADGNMTYGPLDAVMKNFAYDAQNRLTAAGNTTYIYDIGGNRIGKNNGTSQTSYVVNPNAALSQVLIQEDGQGAQTFYIYGLGLIGQENPNGAYRCYHYDYRGSAIALTNENGYVTDRCQYVPSGETVYRSGTTNTPFLFSGRYGIMTDTDDLYYVRARYYNPIVQRYLSPDLLTGRITDPQSLNPYVYCEGNPVIFIDPTGYWAWLNNFTNGIAVSVDNNILFGSAKAVTGNDLESDTTAYKAGKVVGDICSGAAGLITSAAGVAGETGGIALDSTGVAAIVGLPVNIASAGAISYGVKVTVNSGRNLAQDAKDLFVNAKTKGTCKTSTYTKSSLKPGQEIHKEYKADSVDNITKFKEYRLPSGNRIDFIDFESKTIYELKPNNPRAIREGKKQLKGYLKEVTKLYGKGWKAKLDTY